MIKSISMEGLHLILKSGYTEYKGFARDLYQRYWILYIQGDTQKSEPTFYSIKK